jgi:uncharacterized protein (TIGR02145 family)
MKENFCVTNFRNGDIITHIRDDITWTILTNSYDNDESNRAIYGHLYNWGAVEDTCNIAPKSYHVSTDEKWKVLEMYLRMSQSEADDKDWRGKDEGRKLIATSGRGDFWVGCIQGRYWIIRFLHPVN